MAASSLFFSTASTAGRCEEMNMEPCRSRHDRSRFCQERVLMAHASICS
ncbi:hypothetical protein X975_04493, partial [Stegodyphus mimosarum]